jgi:hypothetical protein
MIEDRIFTDQLLLHLRAAKSISSSKDIELPDFTYAFGSPLDAFIYANLFWPNFVEYSGMIFHSEVLNSDDARNRVMQMVAETQVLAEVEKSFNQFDIPSSFFGKRAGDTNDLEDVHLAQMICEMWQARLSLLFPNKTVKAVCTLDEDEEPCITVFQERT